MAGADTYLPETIDIDDHWQGDTFPGAEFTVTRNGVVKDLTGASITMTFLRGNRRVAADDHVLTLGNGLTVTDGPNGVFEMDQISHADMEDWKTGVYHYDVEIIYADGEKKSPIAGTWKITQDKTN
jgi:hypothetical protein